MTDSVINYDKDPVNHAVERVYSLSESNEDTPLVNNVKHAVAVIEETFIKYK